MIKEGIILIILAGLALSSCMKNSRPADKESAEKEALINIPEEIIRREYTKPEGKTLLIIFNKAEDEAVVLYNGESFKLKGQRPASGIWYKNDHYELRGKGEQVELKKDGQTIFKN